MMKMLKMCLTWKVLATLAAMGVGVYLFAPGLLAEAVPLLLLAVCPLSMLLMMWAMQHTQGQQTPQEPDVGLTREEWIARLRTQQAALDDRIEELDREETRPAKNGRGQ